MPCSPNALLHAATVISKATQQCHVQGLHNLPASDVDKRVTSNDFVRHPDNSRNGFCSAQANSFSNVCSFLTTFYQIHPANGLKCLHVNCRSLYPKIDELRNIIQSVKFDCISINESMLDISISDSEIAIDNYMIFRKDRNRNGGGVLLYISKSLKPTKIDDTFHTEIVCVKIHIQRFNILICSLYRPPSSLVEYYDKMICDCENIMALGQDMIIMGDLNLNCFQNDFYHAHPLIINLEEYFQLNQLIRLPTRQAGNSNSLLDVILCSDHLKTSNVGVVQSSFSDHYPIFAVFNLKKPILEQQIVSSRNFNNFVYDNFIHDLHISNVFKNILALDDINFAWNIWKTEFLRICQHHDQFKNVKSEI